MRRTRPAFVVPAAVALLTLALAGCADSTAPGAPTGGASAATSPATSAPRASASASTAPSAVSCSGVFVTVQYGLLGTPELDACAAASGPITAAAALKAVDVTTEGTQKYGDQVVCRVNGLPSASHPIAVPGHAPYSEKCEAMPAAFAYWALWVRSSPKGAWGYAQSGITTEQLRPGQTLGLKFTTGSDTTPPQG